MTDPAPRQQVVAVLTSLTLSAAGQHRYLSTACLHERHEHCRSAVGQTGPKKSATCKFCDATCLCDCHVEG